MANVDPPVADAIAYIPPDPVRQLERSPHPSVSLAKELGRFWGLECLPVLRRTRAAPRQAGLLLADRRGNLRGAFVAALPPRPTVLLVDDVYTTGSTVNAAATALRAAGAVRVEVVTFARAIRSS